MRKLTMSLAAACALATAASAHAQSNVQIYGIIDTGLAGVTRVAGPTTANPTATGHYIGVDSGLLQASRLGFRGREDLGGGLFATFALEGGLAIDTGTFTTGGSLTGRRSTVGLAGKNFGALDIGRRKDFTDEIAAAYSSITPFGTFVTRAHANNLDRIGGNRANNMLYYSTPTINGFRANVTYGFGETAGSVSTGQSAGFGANYDGGNGFAVGFGYWTSKLGVVNAAGNTSSDQGAVSGAGCNTIGLGNPGDTCIKTWMLGSSYTIGNFALRGTVSSVRQPLIKAAGAAAPNFATAYTRTVGSGAFTAGGSNNSSADIVDVGFNYTVSPSILLKTSYIRSSYAFTGTAQDGKLAQYLLGGEYYFSKRTTVYATLSYMTASRMYNPGTLNAAPGADRGTSAYAVGLRHTF